MSSLSVCSSGQIKILLPRYIMDFLNHFDENDREHSLATTDDLVRFWRSKVMVMMVAKASMSTLGHHSLSSSFNIVCRYVHSWFNVAGMMSHMALSDALKLFCSSDKQWTIATVSYNVMSFVIGDKEVFCIDLIRRSFHENWVGSEMGNIQLDWRVNQLYVTERSQLTVR